MNTIKFNLTHLRNEELYQFLTELKKISEDTGVSEEDALKALYAAFVVLYNQLDAGLEQVRKSEHTAKLQTLDQQRDDLYRGLTLLVQTFLHSPVTAKADAAQSIQIVIDTYGDFRNSNYSEETATITNFLDTLNNRCKTQLELLGAVEFLDALAKANKAFDDLMGTRFDEHVGQEHINIRQTRRELEAVYEKLTRLTEALGELYATSSPMVHPFIERLNMRITHFKNLIAQRKGRKAINN